MRVMLNRACHALLCLSLELYVAEHPGRASQRPERRGPPRLCAHSGRFSLRSIIVGASAFESARSLIQSLHGGGASAVGGGGGVGGGVGGWGGGGAGGWEGGLGDEVG